jgi:hypothetical protein
MSPSLIWLKVVKSFSVIKGIVLACSLGTASGCFMFSSPIRSEPSGNRATTINKSDQLDFSLINLTGASFKGIYVSPNTSSGWEENVLADSELRDGEEIEIRFNPSEKVTIWDMRVEGLDGRFAEFKGLKLNEISEMTLTLKLMPRPVVIAEVE